MSTTNSATVYINGRLAIHQGSQARVVTQDICYTGVGRVPIPYQNVARSEDATHLANKVFINGFNACHQQTIFARSYGDEAGDGGGIHSVTQGGKAEFISGSPNVFIEGNPAVRHGDEMVSNNRNTPSAPVLVTGVDVPT